MSNLKINNATTRILSFVSLRLTLKHFKSLGFAVNKIGMGYELIVNGECVFRAMRGNNDWLVRFDRTFME